MPGPSNSSIVRSDLKDRAESQVKGREGSLTRGFGTANAIWINGNSGAIPFQGSGAGEVVVIRREVAHRSCGPVQIWDLGIIFGM